MLGMIRTWHKAPYGIPKYNPILVVTDLVHELYEDINLTLLIRMLENNGDEFGEFGMRDDADAIRMFCTLHVNRVRAIREGVVEVAMMKLKNQVLKKEILEILALLLTNLNSIKGMVEMDVIPCLFEILRENPNPVDTYMCIRILYSILVRMEAHFWR